MSEPKVVTLVPLRTGDLHRDKLWAFCKEWWQTDHPDWPVYEGHHNAHEGPFNRSRAINRAAALAGDDWDVAVIIDADVITNPDRVRQAVDLAVITGGAAVSHDERVMLNQRATTKIVDQGFRGAWNVRTMVETIFYDSVSCSLAVPRTLWDRIGGFDENFCGWGYEDSAFVIAAETLSGKALMKLDGEVFHLWHPEAPGKSKASMTNRSNAARLQAYREADGDLSAVKALLAEAEAKRRASPVDDSLTIPRILHRTLPALGVMDDVAEKQIDEWWQGFVHLHPGWTFHTWRDPLDPDEWPLTSAAWSRCDNGAQKAGLIRLEALYRHGGFYIDSDVEPVRSFEPLTQLQAVAAWEDERVIPDAILGSRPGHPVFETMIEEALTAVARKRGAWESGPGVTTRNLPGRSDVLVLPPGAFYPVHYEEMALIGTRNNLPWVFAEHKWHHSWGTPEAKARLARRQRA